MDTRFLSPYALSGTDIAYAAVPAPIPLRACYAMPGTDIAYAATRLSEALCEMNMRYARCCEIKCKHPQPPYHLYQDSGFFSLIPRAVPCLAPPALLPQRSGSRVRGSAISYAVPGTDKA
eukprot:1926511-Rhodomonas_salina.4